MFERPPLKKAGPLEILDFGSENPSTVVMFHGYGADAYDLSSLRTEIRVSKPLRWIFPQGPLTVPIGPGYTGRAWAQIDMSRHERAVMEGTSVDYSQESAERLNSPKQKVLEMLKTLNLSIENTVFGGFSQGSMLALEVVLDLPITPKGLLLYSSSLFDEPNIRARAPRKPGFPFFQSHGEFDEILGYQGAERLEKVLTECGWDGSLLTFTGGHEIPSIVLRESSSYLQKVMR